MSEWKHPKGLKEIYWDFLISPTKSLGEMTATQKARFFDQRVQAQISIHNIQLHYPNMDRETKKRADKTMRELTETYNLENVI